MGSKKKICILETDIPNEGRSFLTGAARIDERERFGSLIMKIEDARRLAPGMKVGCPEDLEEPAYTGVVVYGPGPAQEDLLGEAFAWITVRDEARGREAVWPSNQLRLLSPLPALEVEEPDDLPSP